VVIDASQKVYYWDGGGNHDTGATITAASWLLLELRNLDFTAGTFDIVIDNVLVQSGAAMYAGAGGPWTLEPKLYNGDTTAGHDFWADDVLVRNYADPEPTFTAWGEEEPLVPPSTPAPITAPWALVPPSQTVAPSGLFTEGGEGMWGLTEMANASEATGNPREMFPMMLAFLLALLAGFAVYGATHNTRMGQRGSLFLQSITSLAVMIFFYVGGGGVIPGWVLIPFGLEALFWLLTRNPQHSAT
jgi:hypothetical protein